jgi:carboxypeptidase Taq
MASMSLHESQSRLWENVVGRSRAFATFAAGELRLAFPDRLGGLDGDRLFVALNAVRPGLIRVTADEATYPLHILLRFRLERALLGGTLAVGDLPAAWNDGVGELLGVQVPSDADGVMQDIHWAAGMFGYFPTYALGSLLSYQLGERLAADVPDLDAHLERGELAVVREWLAATVYPLARLLPPGETVRQLVGGPIAPEAFLDALRRKLHDVARLPAAAA